MTTEILTKYPGGDTPPIKTFPEKLEKDIGNIVGKFEISDGGKEALVLELLEYITKHGKNNSVR